MATKFIIIGSIVLILMFAVCGIAAGQSVKKTGNVYSKVSDSQDIRDYDLKTDFMWEEEKGGEKIQYPIYIHTIKSGEKKGTKVACIFKIAKTSGRMYRCILKEGESIANQIVTGGQLK